MKNIIISRRKFLRLSGAGIACTGAVLLPRFGFSSGSNITAGEVIERIKLKVAIPWKAITVDTVKGGNLGINVTGITTTFMATLDVLQRSAKAGRNFIITHEPTFWNNLDQSEGLTDDPLYRHKMDFINKNNLVVWRFHDHWHARKPDGITEGQLRTLGWDKYTKTDTEAVRSGVFELPGTITLKDFAKDIKTRLHSDNIRVIGDPGLKVKKVGNASNHLRGSVEALGFADAFIVKEADRENDLGEWCRDTVLAGQEKGFIFISHNRGEEFGMDNCATWVRSFVPELPVGFISSGDPFWRTT